MDIKEIDKNFDTTFKCPEDIEWFSIKEAPFSVHGVSFSEDEGRYRRMPKAVADATSAGVAHLSTNTAGGRVRFITNSPYIALRIEEPFSPPFSHMTIEGKNGASIFADGEFAGAVMPTYDQIVNGDPSRGGSGKIVFDGIKNPYGKGGKPYQVDVFMPLYSGVLSIHVGVKQGSVLEPSKPYKHEAPVLFYGSSITQGGCAAKPGDDYVNRLCRMLDTEIINLGFSGNAKGEQVMADYISATKASVFVLDYDHNAPTAEHLRDTHYALYETVRRANPQTPIIMMTMPTIEGYEHRAWNKLRREEIIKSYERAKALGDENLYFVDCYGCFGESVNGECGTVDACHPDSLGFLRMAQLVYPVLNKLLND